MKLIATASRLRLFARAVKCSCAALLAVSCASVRTEPCGFANLPPGASNVLELRLAYIGSVENCPTCVLVEVREGFERNAYYVRRRPDCEVKLSDLVIDDVYAIDERRAISLLFPPHVQARIDACLGVAASASSYSLIATIDGEFLGSGMYVKEDPSLTLYGDEAIQRLGATRDRKAL